MKNYPIGVFDSGIGGLSTLRALRQQLPNEDFIYVADLACSPYGNKTIEFLQQRSQFLTQFLLDQHAKAVVVACNTATAAAVASLREIYALPIIGVEPGVKPAIQRSLSGVVAILATERTIASEKFRALVQQFDDQAQIICQPCPGLADAIEGGLPATDMRRQLLQRFINPLLNKNVDTLVLGCTHYPLIAEEIRQLIPASVELIDTSAAIARQVVRKLAGDAILNPSSQSGRITVYSSSHRDGLDSLFSEYLHLPVIVEHLPGENFQFS